LKAIKIQIVKFISDDQSGFVECRFYDAMNKEHIVQDKVPIVTDKLLDANSAYPQDGIIACEIVNERKNTDEKIIVTVDTSRPWGVDTIEGITQFDLFEEQLTELERLPSAGI
jgi:hypothetical protein